LLERLIVPLERLLAVERHRKVISLKIDAERMPLVRRDFRVRSFLFSAAAVYRVVNRDVVFESIRARDVVVVGILRAPDQSARLAAAWSSRPELGLNFISTNPSLRFVSSFRQMGNVACPDCFKTFGLLGAVLSATTDQFA